MGFELGLRVIYGHIRSEYRAQNFTANAAKYKHLKKYDSIRNGFERTTQSVM